MIVGDNSGSGGGPDGIAKAQAVVASARVRYDAELMDRVPDLRVISRTGIGVDNIALDEATMRGIAVCNVPGGPTVSTAEHTVTLLMATAKQIPAAAQALREGRGDFLTITKASSSMASPSGSSDSVRSVGASLGSA